MKNLILGFLVFITIFSKGQNVDPETFPTVTGNLLNKNVYTNTGGEGKFSISSIKVLDTTSISYADFYQKITNSQLITGMTYIIIDFQTIYDQIDFDASGNLKSTLVTKTGGVEQIWVLALSPNQIADKAYSAKFPKDEIQYDWTYNLTLVNGSPAKGRISERIDEWNNRTDYDHRVIKFIRYDDGNGNFVQINDSGRTAKEFLTFGDSYANGGIIYDNYLGDFYSIGGFMGQEYANNVFNIIAIVSTKSRSIFYNNTFLGDYSSINIFGDFHNNIIMGGMERMNFVGNFYNNKIIKKSTSCSIAGEITNSVFGESIVTSNISGNISNCIFSTSIELSNLSSDIGNCSFSSISNLAHVSIIGKIDNKIIDETTYPFLFGTDYEKKIYLASDNNVYARYFNGTTDINVLIP